MAVAAVCKEARMGSAYDKIAIEVKRGRLTTAARNQDPNPTECHRAPRGSVSPRVPAHRAFLRRVCAARARAHEREKREKRVQTWRAFSGSASLPSFSAVPMPMILEIAPVEQREAKAQAPRRNSKQQARAASGRCAHQRLCQSRTRAAQDPVARVPTVQTSTVQTLSSFAFMPTIGQPQPLDFALCFPCSVLLFRPCT